MQEIADSRLFPEPLRRVLVFVLTITAVVLYAVVLGIAIVATIRSDGATALSLNQGMVNTAKALSALVGAVVAAGFGRSDAPSTVQLDADHAMGGRVATSWHSLKPPSLFERNMRSLGELIGIRMVRDRSSNTRDDSEVPVTSPQTGLSLSAWVGLTYFVVYVLVGAAALIVSLYRPVVPDLISTTGSVFVGTMVASAYTFFSING
jgi:hypothetical protein